MKLKRHIDFLNEESFLPSEYDAFLKKERSLKDFLIPKVEKVLSKVELKVPERSGPLDEYELTSDGERVATWRFMGPEELEIKGDIEGNKNVSSGEYLLAGTIVVKEKFRRKGIYTSIIYAAYEYAKEKGLEGIASLQFDIDSGDFERTDAATAVWEKLLKNDPKVAKITSDPWGDGPESDYLMN
jgi:GNAT superfamily N-acetyltransferase